MLGALVLALNNGARWQVRETNCRIGFVDVLSTCAGRAEGIFAYVLFVNFDGVNFVGVVFQDNADRANEFLDEFGRGYVNVLDPDSRGAINFGVYGIPETYFIDKQGTVVAKITGELQPGVIDDVLEQIILGEQPGSRTLGTVAQ